MRSTIAIVALVSLVAHGVSQAACNIVSGRGQGDCDGVQVNKGSKGHLLVDSYVVEQGIISGATIVRGGELHLAGISNGDITVHKGARFVLRGMVSGTVKNVGGTVEIHGMANQLLTTGGQVVIAGTVERVYGPGAVNFKKGALVGGVPVEKAFRKLGDQ